MDAVGAPGCRHRGKPRHTCGIQPPAPDHLASIRSQGKEGAVQQTTSDSSGPDEYWEIQLGWSELRNGKWTPKKITDATVTTDHQYDKSDIWFNTEIGNGRLVVKIWHDPSPDDPSGDDGNAIKDIGQLVFTGTGKQVLKAQFPIYHSDRSV